MKKHLPTRAFAQPDQPFKVQAVRVAGDFPDVNRYREILSGYDISTFPKLREKDVKALEETLSIDIPTLVKQVQPVSSLPIALPSTIKIKDLC